MVQFYKAPKNTNRNANKFKNNQTMSVTIDTMSSHGEGVCLTHNPPIFVNGALPNETLEIQVLKKHKNHWQAKTTNTNQRQLNTSNTPSPSRVEPFCDYFHQCGGCTTQHCEPKAMLEYKQIALQKQFQKSSDITELPWQAPIQSPLQKESRGYRRKARLAIDTRNPESIKLGFRRGSSSDIISIPACPVLETELQAVMRFLHTSIVETKNVKASRAAFNAVRHVGHITLMNVNKQHSVTVKIVKDLNTKAFQWWQNFGRAMAESVRCEILLSLVQPSSALELVEGEQVEILEHTRTRASATDFIQVNEPVNQAMIERVCGEFSENLPVLDLYCGLGNFTLPLCSTVDSVVGVEGSEEMVRKANAIALKSGVENIKFVCRDLNASDSIESLLADGPVNVLLDPSREGALAVCKQLATKAVTKIVYISCNPQTWQRDAKLLTSSGYSLSSIMLMDMFPYTPHSELFSVFTHS